MGSTANEDPSWPGTHEQYPDRQPRFSLTRERQNRTNSPMLGTRPQALKTASSRMFGLGQEHERSQTPSNGGEGGGIIRQLASTGSSGTRRSRLIMESKLLNSSPEMYPGPGRLREEDGHDFSTHTRTSAVETTAPDIGLRMVAQQGLGLRPVTPQVSISSKPRSLLFGHYEQPNFYQSTPSRRSESRAPEDRSAYSRQSESSPIRGGPEDDISSIMMRGANDLRNAKATVEDQV